MKKNYIFVLVLQAIIMLSFGQTTVNQIIVGNGGIYGNDADHVTLTGINPENFESTFVGEVIRESIQDLIIVGDMAYVAAEDSLAKFDLKTNTKLAAVYHGNLSRLFYANDLLYVSMRSDLNGAPADGKYLKAFDHNLNLLYESDQITTDAAAMCQVGDSLYIAVSGDWQATEGRLAVANSDLSFVREMNLGADAVGIIDLFVSEASIFTVNKSPYGATTGSITTYNANNASWNTNVMENIVGKGVKLVDELLYLGIDHGIGSYSIISNTIVNQQIIADPGSASYINIAAAIFDEINEKFYVTITDYTSLGEGKIYDIQGNELGQFDASVSAEAMAIHYTDETSTFELDPLEASIYPNPAQQNINIQSFENITKVEIYNQAGQLLLHEQSSHIGNINISELSAGLYMVKIYSGQEWTRVKLLKQ